MKPQRHGCDIDKPCASVRFLLVQIEQRGLHCSRHRATRRRWQDHLQRPTDLAQGEIRLDPAMNLSASAPESHSTCSLARRKRDRASISAHSLTATNCGPAYAGPSCHARPTAPGHLTQRLQRVADSVRQNVGKSASFKACIARQIEQYRFRRVRGIRCGFAQQCKQRGFSRQCFNVGIRGHQARRREWAMRVVLQPSVSDVQRPASSDGTPPAQIIGR